MKNYNFIFYIRLVAFFIFIVVIQRLVLSGQDIQNNIDKFSCDDSAITDFVNRGIEYSKFLSNKNWINLFKHQNLGFVFQKDESRCYNVNISIRPHKKQLSSKITFSQRSFEERGSGYGEFGEFMFIVMLDDKKNVLLGYSEIIPDLITVFDIEFNESGNLKNITKNRGSDWELEREMEWNNEGKLVKDKKYESDKQIKKLDNAKFIFPDVKKIEKSFASEWQKLPQQLPNKINSFKKIEKIKSDYQNCNFGSFFVNTASKNISVNQTFVDILYKENLLKSIFCSYGESTMKNNKIYQDCYYIQFNKSGQIEYYIEGNLNKENVSIPDNGNSFDANTISITPGLSVIEIKYHSTGYPATYKSITKNRLYGRQIEWNDKGEVISDIDLDIPKEWKDAPKKTDKSIKK
jgi:hypothetical protein